MCASTLSLKLGAERAVRGGKTAVGERESNLVVKELLGVGPAGLRSLDLLNLHDLNTAVRGPVAAVHLLEKLVHGTNPGGVAEFLPDVVVGRARLVTERDAKVLDGVGLLLKDLRKVS